MTNWDTYTNEELTTEYIRHFGLANTYYGETRRSAIHEAIADRLELDHKDEGLEKVMMYLEKPENISFPIKDISDYHQMLRWEESEIWKWGTVLYKFLEKKFGFKSDGGQK